MHKKQPMRGNTDFRFLPILLFILSCLLGTTACLSYGYRPKTGDLLFVADTRSDFSRAIVQATAQGDSLKFSHVGIVCLENGSPYVLEASSEHGVVKTGWPDFLEQAPSVEGKPGIVVMRVRKPFPVKDAIRRAESHLGEAYDWTFLPDNGKMYCSELVYEAYRFKDGSPIFSARPMNFRDAEGNLPAFWKTLFEKEGLPVPEGVPGTNPNDMRKEACLVEVDRLF